MDNQESKQLKTGYQVIAEKTLSEEEAAHILGVTKNTLSGIRLRNAISFRRITKIQILYTVDDILEYLDNRKVKAKFLSE